MSDWESMQQAWQSVDNTPAARTSRPVDAALVEQMAKRARYQRWYLWMEALGSPVALAVLIWGMVIVNSGFKRAALVTVGLGMIVYWILILKAYRSLGGKPPVRPWAIRARMLRQSRFWMVVCRAATGLFLVLLLIPISSLFVADRPISRSAFFFILGWAGLWIAICQVCAYRVWNRSRAWCIGPARSARYRIF